MEFLEYKFYYVFSKNIYYIKDAMAVFFLPELFTSSFLTTLKQCIPLMLTWETAK